MARIIIEDINAYEYSSSERTYTYQLTGAVRVWLTKKKCVYLIPYGVDYECDGGHFIEQISEEEFTRRFSFVPIHLGSTK